MFVGLNEARDFSLLKLNPEHGKKNNILNNDSRTVFIVFEAALHIRLACR